jgi:hypothetical protein
VSHTAYVWDEQLIDAAHALLSNRRRFRQAAARG